MGSVTTSIKCPNCGNEQAYNEFWYRSDEEFTMCDMCGYMYERFFTRNEEGKIMYDTNAIPLYDIKELNHPYCCIQIIGDTGGQMISVGTEEEYNLIVNEVKKSDNEKIIGIEQCRYLGNNKWSKLDILTNTITLFSEDGIQE